MEKIQIYHTTRNYMKISGNTNIIQNNFKNLTSDKERHFTIEEEDQSIRNM